MIEATLERENHPGETEILGHLTIGNFKFATLELPWNNNESSRSCVPSGEYTVKFKRMGAKPRTYELQDVPERHAVLIHAGNLPKDTRGCILIGIDHQTLQEQRATYRSRDAMEMLRSLMGISDFKLTIKGGGPDGADIPAAVATV